VFWLFSVRIQIPTGAFRGFPQYLQFYIWKSSAGIEMDCVPDDRGSFPGKGDIILLSTASRPILWPAEPPLQWIPATLSPCVIWQGREADRSPQSNAKVKNCGAISSLPNTSSLSGV
jgi:hypothetical protein